MIHILSIQLILDNIVNIITEYDKIKMLQKKIIKFK